MTKYDPNFKEEKVVARVGQKAVVFTSDYTQVLILRRSDKCTRAGGWDFPGGGVDFGEDPETGVKRELLEETGIKDPKALTLASVFSTTNGNNEFVVMIGYRCFVDTQTITLSWEHDHYEWVSLHDALTRDWPDFHRTLLTKAISSINPTFLT